MDTPKAAGSVFMCRLCNLFSPSRSLLLDHCSQLHPQQDPPDDIIIPLQPLGSEPVETPAVETENPVKRKRGRPKGSTNKSKAKSTESPENHVHRQEEEKKKKEGDKSCSPGEGESHDRILELACKNCHRKFSNRRQILKHICLKEEEDEGDEEEEIESVDVRAGEEGSRDLNHEKSHPSKRQNTGKSEKDTGGFRSKRNVRSHFSKEGDTAKENKKSIINVVLTEDKTLPGVYKMVPVEDGFKGTDSAADNTHTPQPGVESQSQDTSSEAPISDSNPKTHQESSPKPTTTTTTTTSINRGFQEYSIKQDDNNLPPSHLKIFTCEFCNKIFKFRHSLVAHLRTHTQEKPFKCPHCDYASAIKANLNVHLRKHTGEKFSCPHCPFKCLSPGHLKVHIERVHLKVKQHCSFCEKKYGDVKNLLKHMENSHDLKDPEVYRCYQQLSLKTRQCLRQLLYNCPTCKRRFKHHLERERHLLVHGPLRPFACLLCDHAATKMDALAAHVRKHLFLYVCSACDGKFVSCQRLKSHLRESHPDLDQDQAFASCIDSSYFLIQPGGDARWDEEREDTEGGGQGQDGDTEPEPEGERNGAGEEMFPGGEAEQLDVVSREATGEGQGESVPERETRGEGENVARGVISVGTSAGGAAPADTQDSRAPGTGNTDGDEPNTTTVTVATTRTSVEERTRENTINTHATSPVGNSEVSDLGLNTSSSPAPPGAEDHTPHFAKEAELFHQGAFQKVLSSLQKTQLNMETFQRLRKVYGDLECQYCGKLFWYKVQYNVHVRTHTKEHLHYCSKCDYSSITKSSLKRHQIQKHSGLLLPCSNPGCKYSTPDKYKLQAHQRTHQEEGKSVACPVCQQSFAVHKLKYHIKSSHPDSLPGRSKALMAQSAEKCPYCDAYFLRNSRDYKQHIWAHEGLKPYLCGLCDYAGRSRSNLKTHMNRHNTEKPHLCDLCGKKFKSKFTLKSHRQSHTKEGKRFQCSECDFTSVSKPALLRHMEQHAEFKPFRCAHCHYTCNLTGPLKRHYRLKHPDQKYENTGPGLPNAEALKQQGGRKCPECDFVYGTKWELNRHLKSKHSLKEVQETWEAGETIEAQYVTVREEELLTEAPVAVLHDNVNIQQIGEFSSEAHDAVTSMVAMAPGTVTVVQQLQVADEQEVDTCSNQLMVVNSEGDLHGEQVMVVEDAHGLEALTVLTEGENTHHYIVYVQEHTVEIN